jgi:hypothetical protein
MRVRVVCISRTLGAGGELIGSTVAQRLRFRYVDEEIITAASEKARVDATAIADAEHQRSFIGRLMATLAVVPQAKSQSRDIQRDSNRGGVGRGTYRALIREAIAEVAAEGRAVIVAHAASLMLGSAPEVLRVLITASPATRAERIGRGDDTLDARRAARAVQRSDRERAEYLREFYDVRDEQPTHYDLVINTDVLTAEQAVGVILSAARGPAS